MVQENEAAVKGKEMSRRDRGLEGSERLKGVWLGSREVLRHQLVARSRSSAFNASEWRKTRQNSPLLRLIAVLREREFILSIVVLNHIFWFHLNLKYLSRFTLFGSLSRVVDLLRKIILASNSRYRLNIIAKIPEQIKYALSQYNKSLVSPSPKNRCGGSAFPPKSNRIRWVLRVIRKK